MMIDSSDGLFFSESGLENRSLFFSPLNDINIYVEDVGKEYIYEEIFERLFEGRIKLFSIFPLGGKNKVLKVQKTCEAYDDNGKPNVFIVDGDFDNLWKERKQYAPNLIYLDRYNIESYFLDKNAVVRYMRNFLKCPRETVETMIMYEEWEASFYSEASNLFILFSIANRYCPRIPSINFGMENFFDASGGIIKSKVEEYGLCVSKEIGDLQPYIEEVQKRLSEQFNGYAKNKALPIICGKYQLESLARRIRSCCGKNVPRDMFYYALRCNFDLTPLQFLKEKVFHLAERESYQTASAG